MRSIPRAALQPMTSSGPDSHDRALEIFADWLSRRESGEKIEFADLVCSHPNLASELAELEATWKRLAAASDPARSSLSLHERLTSRF